MKRFTPERLREQLERLPRADLATQPTPVHDLPQLSQWLGGPRILMKRDDMTGLAFGGNKARKLEFLVADALRRGADTIVTSAAAQSNMLRMTAAAARRCGLDVHLVMRGTGEEAVQGNLLLDHLFGAKITFIPTTDPYSPLSLETMAQVVDELKASGRQPYVIDLRYESGGLAALGYVRAMIELQEQLGQLGIQEATILCATGSGGTQAGLVLGNRLLAGRYRIAGVSAQLPAPGIAPRIAAKCREAAHLLDLDVTIPAEEIAVDDRWIGPRYGVPSAESLEALCLAARYEGIVLDPIYSGKGFSGLIGQLREGRFSTGDCVVFIHTGGTPALFTHAAEVDASFSR